jgi:hypothetical protein
MPTSLTTAKPSRIYPTMETLGLDYLLAAAAKYHELLPP